MTWKIHDTGYFLFHFKFYSFFNKDVLIALYIISYD